MDQRFLYSLLAFAGAAPFFLCAVLPLLGFDAIGPFGRLDRVASSYGLGIITFLAGTHWATHLYQASNTPLNLFATSNVIFLVVWFAFVLAGLEVVLAIQVAAFLVLLFIDYRLLQAEVISSHYFRTRTIATAVAVVSLLIILVSQAGTAAQ